ALIVQASVSPKQEEGPVASVEVLVANKKLLVGEVIKAEAVRWQAWPEDAVYRGLILRKDQPDDKKLSVYDTPLRRVVEAAEPVTTQAIIEDIKGKGNFLAASLAPSMRAVSISVKSDTGVGGFIVPGDNVDVILSYAPQVNNDLTSF